MAVRHKGSAALDPYRACLGIAAAAAARGARIFERSPVKRVTFTRRAARVFTADGTIRADRVVVATGAPTALTASLARHFWYRSSFLALTEPVPVKIRSQLGRRALVVRDLATPPHRVRWVDDERLLVSGADRESPPPRQRDNVIVQRTGQLMYELSTLYPDISGILPSHGWAAEYARSADGLPYIGSHRNFPHHLFAFGDASGSATGAYLASRILLRHFLGEREPADATFEFTRYGR
jgi:glycine/D-amino acid oxidase-like deaminating enzyme